MQPQTRHAVRENAWSCDVRLCRARASPQVSAMSELLDVIRMQNAQLSDASDFLRTDLNDSGDSCPSIRCSCASVLCRGWLPQLVSSLAPPV